MNITANRHESSCAVTGAFGYSGRRILRKLHKTDCRVITLTSSRKPQSSSAGDIETHPLDFQRPDLLARALEGIDVLYNTYWVRFNHRDFNHMSAVDNSEILFRAARSAGVRRVVHTSITNPSIDSPLSYFRGKAAVEEALKSSGLSYAILRPAVFFGGDDILINNIAWMLRRFPVFGVFGDGSYRLRPIHVDDFAEAAVRLGTSNDNLVLDAVGPDRLSYRELVAIIGQAIGYTRPVFSAPPRLGWIFGKVVGIAKRDVTITMDEIRGLTAGLLDVESPALGSTSLVDWLEDHRTTIGRRYANELSRRKPPVAHRNFDARNHESGNIS